MQYKLNKLTTTAFASYLKYNTDYIFSFAKKYVQKIQQNH